MAQVTSNLSQRETLRKHVSSACVTQGVRSCAWRLNAEALESSGYDSVKAAMSKRSAWRIQTEEDLSIIRMLWAHLTDVPQYRLCN